jgi:predicted regulator of Ras-like GTPase activity (Roadblock/LC7/MglB family)
MTNPNQPTSELNWLLDELVSRVGEIRHAIVLSGDGLPVGASTNLSREDRERFAAIASGFHSLAKGTGQNFQAGGVVQTMVELEGGFLFVVAAGARSCLAVFGEANADIGLVAFEMARLVKQVREHLYVSSRQHVLSPVSAPE